MKKTYLIIIPLIILTILTISYKNQLQSKLVSWFQKPTVSELATTEYVNKILAQTGKYDYQVTTAYYRGRRLPIPESIASLPLDTNVLGLRAYAAEGEKRVEVDLTNQRLYAKEGNVVVYEFPISSGMPWTPTVTGEYRIWAKLKYTRMAGGCDIGDCYDLPNVPYTQYFYKGYALHGAYWHNDFGRPKSHGCVNISIPDAEKLYYWTNPYTPENVWGKNSTTADPGTKVIIYGRATL